MHDRNWQVLASALLAVSLAGCGGTGSGGGGSTKSGGMDLVSASNGFGLLLPHTTFRLDAAGAPTAEVVAITDRATLVANVTPLNPVHPTTPWPTTALLPDGSPGNHFLHVRFTRPVDPASVLSAGAASGLAGTLVVLSVDPATNVAQVVPGRAFVGGRTAVPGPDGAELQTWVALDDAGAPVAADVGGASPGLGFPGTQGAPFAGAADLVRAESFVFVPDADGDLATHEAFPAGRQVVARVTEGVRSLDGALQARPALACSTVGADGTVPELATAPPPLSTPMIQPGGGDTDVDPSTAIRLTFTEPVQPSTVGALPAGGPAALSAAVSIRFGPPSQLTNVPFHALPPSVLDLSVWELQPGFAFPGSGPAGLPCSTYNQVRVALAAGLVSDLSGNPNQLAAQTDFFTGEGPGIVNAPVAPNAVYVARTGADPSISVVDTGGFGAGTGSPLFDFTYQTFPPGSSNFPNDPNVRLQGAALFPPLAPGTCTIDGGSSGVFTLTVDSNLDDRLLRAPLVTQVGDMQLGWSLDVAFNNGQEALGCQAGGGNLCAISGVKLVDVGVNTQNSLIPTLFQPPNNPIVTSVPGGQNPISFAPHPNPPPLVFPPLCQVPFIGGQEPTSTDNATGTNGVAAVQNLLVPGDAFGDPNNGVPPSGLVGALQNAYFHGPSPPGTPLSGCQRFQQRQQVGHFRDMADRARGEIVVLNSNRFTVLDRIPVPDPNELAIGPNLDFLAVTNPASDTVSFIDVDPGSASFHTVVKTTQVGRAPAGIAWDPGNEDILVCNEGEGTVSVISSFSLAVRKTVQNTLSQPFDVVITSRQTNFGFQRNVYYGWILNRSGSISLFESGPNGPNGWGFDDVVGRVPFPFDTPKKIVVDHLNLNGSVWVVHEGPLAADGTPSGLSGGALTNVFIESASFGPQLLALQQFANVLSLRDLGFGVGASIGEDRLTGVPVDVAFDNLVNLGAMPNAQSSFGAGFPIQLNGKGYVRTPIAPVGVNQAQFALVAVPASSQGTGAIDVLRLDAGFQRVDVDARTPGTQSIPAPGVRSLSHYFRQ